MITTPKDPDPRVLKYLKFAEFQRHDPDEAEIASKFRRASAQDVFGELKGYGFPVCELCGATPVVGEHCKTKRRRGKARTVEGEAEELPPAANAATTFRDTIRTLEVRLEQVISLKETLQGGYFIGEGETEEENGREARGAQWHPHPDLADLVATSILVHRGDWGFVERLLDELHPNPAEANKQQLVRFIYGKNVGVKGRPILDKEGRQVDYGDGLLDRTTQVAALIRGRPKVRRGVKGPPIPSYHQLTAWHMRSLVDKGYSREHVAQTSREGFAHWKEKTLQSLHEELEFEKAGLDQDEIEEYEREIQRVEKLEYDQDEFNRIWDLARNLG